MLAMSASSALNLSLWRYYTTPEQVTRGVQEGLIRVQEEQQSSSESVSGETDILYEMLARNVELLDGEASKYAFATLLRVLQLDPKLTARL